MSSLLSTAPLTELSITLPLALSTYLDLWLWYSSPHLTQLDSSYFPSDWAHTKSRINCSSIEEGHVGQEVSLIFNHHCCPHFADIIPFRSLSVTAGDR